MTALVRDMLPVVSEEPGGGGDADGGGRLGRRERNMIIHT